MNENLAGAVSESGARKPYDRPRLEVYGDLSRLTTAVAKVSAIADGGTGLTDKTH